MRWNKSSKLNMFNKFNKFNKLNKCNTWNTKLLPDLFYVVLIPATNAAVPCVLGCPIG